MTEAPDKPNSPSPTTPPAAAPVATPATAPAVPSAVPSAASLEPPGKRAVPRDPAPAAASPPDSAPPSGAPSASSSPESRELRARVHQLEQTLQDMRTRHLADLKALRQSQHLLNAVLENSPSIIYVKDTQGRYILVNRRAEQLLGRSRAEVLGRTDAELFTPEAASEVSERDRLILSQGEPQDFEEQRRDDTGAVRDFLTTKFPLTDASGAVTGVCGIATEITERKRAAEERTALQLQVIEAQRAALRELSTPLIPLAEGVLAMPLIGTIDAARAEQILQTLLDGVSEQRARVAILDITGVKIVDAQVASALINAAHAVRLLGAHVILTGIRAEVAQALVHLGADLSDLTTRSTLQSGIAYALKRLSPA